MKKTTQLLLAVITTILFSLPVNGQITNYATLPYSTGFESATLDANWYTTASASSGRIQIWDSNTLTWNSLTAMAHTGTYWLGMDNNPGGNLVTTEAWMGLDMTGANNQRLQFWWSEWNEETHIEDGLYISDDGGATFIKVLDLNGPNYTDLQWYQFDMSLDSINLVHGLSFTSTYVVKFQQHDNYYFAGGNDGFLIDDIDVYFDCKSSSVMNIAQCSAYTVPSGDETYTVSGTYIDTIPNAALCDSLIIINLSINTSSATINETVCNTSYTVPSGDETYTASGTYMDTITNSLGCDSVMTINLTVGSSTSSSINPVACVSYSAPDGQIYNTSGTYTAIIPNSVGCDSTISINLTIATDSITMVETACDSFTWSNGNTYTSSGIYTQTLTNMSGCDSVITLDLTVNAGPSMTILSSDGVNLVTTMVDSHIWLDCSDNSIVSTSGNTYMATANGDYAVIGTLNGCTDTSDCYQVINVGIEEYDNLQLLIYPNPTTDALTIETAETISSLKLYNVIGELVDVNLVLGKAVSLASLEKGVYYLVIRLDDGREVSRKVIKQ